MAGIYAPIIANYPNGVVSVVSTTGTSYEQIINSMGSFVYGVDSMYVQSNSTQQVLEPIVFSQYDVNGTREGYSQITTIDPYQYQSSITFDLARQNVILNGRTTLSTQLLSNEFLRMTLYTSDLSNRTLLGGKDIFEEDDFYHDYTEVIDDENNPEENLSNVEKVDNVIEQISTPEGVKATIQPVLQGSSSNALPTIKLINNPLAKTPTIQKKKENPTYWIYVVAGYILTVGYLLKNKNK
jgi:hypothetical protein